MDKKLIGMCGAYCGVCEWKEKTNCPGCQQTKSKMFWGTCDVAGCSISRGLEHCGMCSDLPCTTLQDYFNHPEHGDNGERLANLRSWAKGDDTFMRIGELKEKKPE